METLIDRITYEKLNHADFIAKHQDMYPPEMQITDPAIWMSDLESTPYSVRCYTKCEHSTWNHMVGWRIFRRESDKYIYVSDLAVLPAYQGYGLAKKIIKFSLREPRWHGEAIHSFLRKTSYHLVANTNLITEAGYKLVFDRFHPNHYYNRFGLEEDAHEIILEPLG